MNREEDIYIKLLKEAKEDFSQGKAITVSEFYNRFNAFYYGRSVDQTALAIIRHSTFGEIYGNVIGGSEERYLMTLEAYMRLLEYMELNHSLDESRQARKEANIALVVAIIAIVAQLTLWAIDKFADLKPPTGAP